MEDLKRKKTAMNKKALTLNDLDPLVLGITHDRKWYAQLSNIEVRHRDGTLWSLFGKGFTVEEAIDNLWDRATNIDEGSYLVLKIGRRTVKSVRWNGYMWEDVRP